MKMGQKKDGLGRFGIYLDILIYLEYIWIYIYGMLSWLHEKMCEPSASVGSDMSSKSVRPILCSTIPSVRSGDRESSMASARGTPAWPWKILSIRPGKQPHRYGKSPFLVGK